MSIQSVAHNPASTIPQVTPLRDAFEVMAYGLTAGSQRQYKSRQVGRKASKTRS